MPSPTKLLIFAADPSDAARLRLGHEIREIETSRQRSTYRDRFASEQSFATRARDLSQQILTLRPSIVHFSGHGTGTGRLALEDERGRTHLVSTDAHADLFRLFEGQIPYVIGMSQEIGDRAAIDFSRGFCEALFAGEAIERAFEFGRSAIHIGAEVYDGTLRWRTTPTTEGSRGRLTNRHRSHSALMKSAFTSTSDHA